MKFAVVVILALFVALAVRATRGIVRDQAAIAAIATRQDVLRARIVALEIRLQTAKDSSSKSEEQLAALGMDSGRGNASAPIRAGQSYAVGDAPRPSGPPSAMTLIASDPQKWMEYRRNYREHCALRYGAVFKWLGLTSEQIERFLDVEVSLEETAIDLSAALELHRLDRDSAEYKKLYGDYNKARVTPKQEILGDLTNKYLEYFRTESVRWYPRELAYAGIFSGETITAAQIERVADILVATCKRQSMQSPAKPGPWAYPSGLNWSAAAAQLKGVLSPTQIETLGLLIDQDKSRDRLDERRERLTAEFKGKLPTN